jgi:demethylsterigmatocystin 6-O-methyltransferase
MHSAFQLGHDTELPAFIWALTQPKMVEDFHMWMAAVYGDRPTTWLDVFDIPKHCESSADEDVIFVDIAGGIGHQCALLKAKYPELKGRVVLEDLAMVIPQAIPTPGVENIAIDMWQKQPIKGEFTKPSFSKNLIILTETSIGAKTYYMRMILHEYPDKRATDLLKKTAEVMTADSVLIIDELVIPNKGAHGHATQFDMTMMSSLSSIERTDKQWDALLKSAGFNILEKKAYAPTGESIIAVKPKRLLPQY